MTVCLENCKEEIQSSQARDVFTWSYRSMLYFSDVFGAECVPLASSWVATIFHKMMHKHASDDPI